MPNRRLLVIDDSVTIRALIEQLFLGESSVQIVGIVASGEEAIDVIEHVKPDVITLDIMLPGIDGFAVLDFVMTKYPAAVIIVSSSGTEGSDLCTRAVARGASGCFDKARIVRDAPRLRTAVLNAKRGRRVEALPL